MPSKEYINNLINKYQKNNDQDAFNELYKIHQPLIRNVSAKNYNLYNINYESEMNFAFYNAVRTYNSSKKACFSTYFKTCTDNQIKVCLKYLSAYKRKIDKEFGSLDALCNIDGKDEITILDQIKDNKIHYERDILVEEIYNKAKTSLSKQEQELLELIYKGYTYKEIGEIYGKTSACIRARFLKIIQNKTFLTQIQQLRSDDMKEIFLIIDGNNIACRAAMVNANPLINSKGIETGIIYRFLKSFIGVLKTINPTHLVVCWDVNRDTWRSELYPAYKANRGVAHQSNHIAFNEIKRILNAIGVINVELDKYEGDDLVGTFANLSTADETYIVSGDRDVFQCINPHTKVIYPSKTGYLTIDEDYMMNTFKVKGNDYVQLKALMGDSGDNIPGIKGVSLKTAQTILEQYRDIHNLQNIDNINIKRINNNDFKKWQQQMDIILKLVTIDTHVPIKKDMEDCECNIDWYKALPMFRQLEFNSFINNIQNLPKGGSQK